MRNNVEHWPPDQWHPAYESIKEWLENEAPSPSPLVVDAFGKQRNKRMRIWLTRRKA